MSKAKNGTATEGQAVIRILIADDHAVVRDGLRMLLEAAPDMAVVGEAEDGQVALARTGELRPDILLLDLTMPNTGGLEVLRKIRESSPQTQVVVLTMHDDQGYLREALAAGASGYVLKRAAHADLLEAIRIVHRGGTYLHPAHTKLLVESVVGRHGAQAPSQLAPALSPREKEILRLTALGYTSQQAATMLYLSVKTVETYRARMMAKLGLQNRAELVRYAMRQGLLKEE